MNLRYARHTNALSELSSFYQDVIGLVVSGSFQDHEGYNGVFLTSPKSAWELEFTQNARKASHNPDPDDALVFYAKSLNEFEEYRERVVSFGIEIIENLNPYWNRNGISFRDPDGFLVIIAKPKIG